MRLGVAFDVSACTYTWLCYTPLLNEEVLDNAGGLVGSSVVPLDIALDDIVRLRKPHPCGSTDWKVVRLGADIGLVCLGCGHRIMLPRGVLTRRIKTFVQHGPRPTPEQLAYLRDAATGEMPAPESR